MKSKTNVVQVATRKCVVCIETDIPERGLETRISGLVGKLRRAAKKSTRKKSTRVDKRERLVYPLLHDWEDQLTTVRLIGSLERLEESTNQAFLAGQLTGEERDTLLWTGENCLKALCQMSAQVIAAHESSLAYDEWCPTEILPWDNLFRIAFLPFVVPVRMRYSLNEDVLEVRSSAHSLEELRESMHLDVHKFLLKPLKEDGLSEDTVLCDRYVRVPLNGGFISFPDLMNIFLQFGLEVIRYE